MQARDVHVGDHIFHRASAKQVMSVMRVAPLQRTDWSHPGKVTIRFTDGDWIVCGWNDTVASAEAPF